MVKYRISTLTTSDATGYGSGTLHSRGQYSGISYQPQNMEQWKSCTCYLQSKVAWFKLPSGHFLAVSLLISCYLVAELLQACC